MQVSAINNKPKKYVETGNTECSVVVVVVWWCKAQMIQTPIVDTTQQNHHEYDHESTTDKNVRIILANFANYPHHLC